MESLGNPNEQIALLEQENKKAAEIGLALINERNSLRLEIDSLSEENYAIKRRLETKIQLVDDSDAEITQLRATMEQLEETIVSRLQDKFETELDSKNQLCRSLEEELEKCRVREATRLEEFQEARKELELLRQRTFLSDDSLLNQTNNNNSLDVSKLALEKEQLNCELQKVREELVVANEHIRELRKCIEARNGELQEQKSQIKRDMEMNEDLNEQLFMVRQQLEGPQVDGKVNAKGNSIFAEVNDHRLLVEKELIRAKNRQDDLKLENKELSKRVESLNNQLAAALILKSENNAFNANCKDVVDLQMENAKLRQQLVVLGANMAKEQQRRELSDSGSFLGGRLSDKKFPHKFAADRSVPHDNNNTMEEFTRDVVEQLKKQLIKVNAEAAAAKMAEELLRQRHAAELTEKDVALELRKKEILELRNKEILQFNRRLAKQQAVVSSSKPTELDVASKRSERIPLGPSEAENQPPTSVAFGAKKAVSFAVDNNSANLCERPSSSVAVVDEHLGEKPTKTTIASRPKGKRVAVVSKKI